MRFKTIGFLFTLFFILILLKFLFSSSLKTIVIITPTYARYQQLAELHRLRNAFIQIKNLHWIIVEDSNKESSIVQNFLRNTGIFHTHLTASTPLEWKIKPEEPFWSKPKGIAQRNAGLDYIRQSGKFSPNSVLYFADDDNSYSLELFDEIRKTQVARTWPVGLAGELPWEGCIGDGEGRVSRFWAAFKPDRPFPLDMAAFAVSVRLVLQRPRLQFHYRVPIGMQESRFMSDLGLSRADIEAGADNCNKILVWHLRTSKPLMKEGYLLAKREVKFPVINDEFYSEY